MMGLLPLSYSKIFKREKLILRIFLLFVFGGMIFILGIIFILPSYFSVLFSLDHVLRSLGTEEILLKRKNVGEIESKVSYINSLTDSYFLGESKRKSFSQSLLSLTNPASNDIKITSVEFEKSEENESIFHIRGESADRNALILYSQKLRQLPQVKELRSPISNLLQEKNLKFLLELVINSDYKDGEN